MRREATGRHELTSTAGEAVRASCWRPLPADPPVVLHGPLQVRHERALLTCSHLDGVSTLLPDPELFLDAYLRREALLSSQIEATEPLWARQPSPAAGRAGHVGRRPGLPRQRSAGKSDLPVWACREPAEAWEVLLRE